MDTKWTPDQVAEILRSGSPRQVLDKLDGIDGVKYMDASQFKVLLDKAKERITNGEDRFKGRKSADADTIGESEAGGDDNAQAAENKSLNTKQRRIIRAQRHSYRSEGDSARYPNPYVRRRPTVKSS